MVTEIIDGDPDERIDRDSLDTSVELAISEGNYQHSSFEPVTERVIQPYPLPKEYLTSSGEIDYLKIGKILVEKRRLKIELETENRKEYSGNSALKKWMKKNSERKKNELSNKISRLEEKLDAISFQREAVPGNVVLTFSGICSVPWHFDIEYIALQKGKEKKLVKITYNSESDDHEITYGPYKQEKIVCVLTSFDNLLNQEEIRTLQKDTWGHPQPLPVLIKQLYYDPKEKFGRIDGVNKTKFNFSGIHYNFEDLGKIYMVQKLVPVFKEPERCKTYRT